MRCQNSLLLSSVLATIFLQPLSAQTGFIESFDGGGNFFSIDSRLLGFDNPGWNIVNEFNHGNFENGGFRIVNDQGTEEIADLTVISNEFSYENGSFIHRIDLSDVTLDEAGGQLQLTHRVNDDEVGGGASIVLNNRSELDVWEITYRHGNERAEFEVDSRNNIALQIVFHERTSQFEFAYENTTADGDVSSRWFGPVLFSRSDEELHRVSLAFKSIGNGKVAAATIDHWAVQPMEPGDFNYDMTVDSEDLSILTKSIKNQTHDLRRDLNADELVDFADLQVWISEIRNTFFGDSDLDGEFNSGDLTAVFIASEYEDEVEVNSTWATGDWNGDAEFDSSDLVLAFQDGGYEIGPRIASLAVPEPSSITAIMLTSLLVFGRKRQRLS